MDVLSINNNNNDNNKIDSINVEQKITNDSLKHADTSHQIDNCQLIDQNDDIQFNDNVDQQSLTLNHNDLLKTNNNNNNHLNGDDFCDNNYYCDDDNVDDGNDDDDDEEEQKQSNETKTDANLIVNIKIKKKTLNTNIETEKQLFDSSTSTITRLSSSIDIDTNTITTSNLIIINKKCLFSLASMKMLIPSRHLNSFIVNISLKKALFPFILLLSIIALVLLHNGYVVQNKLIQFSLP